MPGYRDRTILCKHCGARMKWCMGPAPNVPVHTYFAECRRMDLPAVPGVKGSIYPQRCGNACFSDVEVQDA